MDQSEISRLQAYLRRVLGASTLSVRAKSADEAELLAGAAALGEVTRDDDEGELSYFVNVGVSRATGAKRDAPIDDAERIRLQAVLREKLGAPRLDVKARPRKTDSAEVYVGEEFIGTLSRDEESRDFGYFLTMSILEMDLDE